MGGKMVVILHINGAKTIFNIFFHQDPEYKYR